MKYDREIHTILYYLFYDYLKTPNSEKQNRLVVARGLGSGAEDRAEGGQSYKLPGVRRVGPEDGMCGLVTAVDCAVPRI